jgi:hypothetical protein
VHCQLPIARPLVFFNSWSGLVRSECHSVDGCGWRLLPSNLSTGMQECRTSPIPHPGRHLSVIG